jgi:hypothetical protein
MDRAGKNDRQPPTSSPHAETLTLQALRDAEAEAGSIMPAAIAPGAPTAGRGRARGYPSKDGAKSGIAPA